VAVHELELELELEHLELRYLLELRMFFNVAIYPFPLPYAVSRDSI
jgi:hypothetical protein